MVLWSGFLALVSQLPGKAMLTVQSRALIGLKSAVGLDVSTSSLGSWTLLFFFLAGLLLSTSRPFWWMTTDEALRFYTRVSIIRLQYGSGLTLDWLILSFAVPFLDWIFVFTTMVSLSLITSL
jgi:hypothetical protein